MFIIIIIIIIIIIVMLIIIIITILLFYWFNHYYIMYFRRRLSRLLITKQESNSAVKQKQKKNLQQQQQPVTSPFRPRETIQLLDKRNINNNNTIANSPRRTHSRSLSPISRYNIDNNIYNTHPDIYRNSFILKKKITYRLKRCKC